MEGHGVKISAADFKARCLKLMDRVDQSHEEIIVTKRGRPVVKLVPVNPQPEKPLFGYMRGSAIIHGDITAPLDEKWNADN